MIHLRTWKTSKIFFYTQNDLSLSLSLCVFFFPCYALFARRCIMDAHFHCESVCLLFFFVSMKKSICFGLFYYIKVNNLEGAVCKF